MIIIPGNIDDLQKRFAIVEILARLIPVYASPTKTIFRFTSAGAPSDP
jgi:hypothetical protein